MNEFKGTKGKWVLVGGWDNDGKGCFPSVIIHGTEQSFKNNYGRNGITINVSHDQRAESIMANAQLIAHSPEMLEKLSLCKVMFSKGKRLTTTDMAIMVDEIKDLLTRATTI